MAQKIAHMKASRKGFTIIELLIVVIVIGILATITVVSYSAVRKNAVETAAKSELIDSGEGFAAEQVFASTKFNPRNSKFLTRETDNTVIDYSYGNTKSYCMVARSKSDSSVVFHQFTGEDKEITIGAGECPTPNYRTSYRCLVGKVASQYTFTNTTSSTLLIHVSHTASTEEQDVSGIAPGETKNGISSLRVSSVERGVIDFKIYDAATNELFDTYYQASPAMSC